MSQICKNKRLGKQSINDLRQSLTLDFFSFFLCKESLIIAKKSILFPHLHFTFTIFLASNFLVALGVIMCEFCEKGLLDSKIEILKLSYNFPHFLESRVMGTIFKIELFDSCSERFEIVFRV
jgi:hypothetical protein